MPLSAIVTIIHRYVAFQLTFPQLSIKLESNDDAVSREPMRSCVYRYHVLPPFSQTWSDKQHDMQHGNSADIRDYDHQSLSVITVLQWEITWIDFNARIIMYMEQLLAYFGGR